MPTITVRSLCDIGRIGNQLFLFCFARGYALAHNCDLQIPADWWGREVFPDAAKLPPIKVTLPQTELDSVTTRPLNRYFGRTDIDLRVFAQHQVYLDYYTRTQVREWLTFKPEWERFAPLGENFSVSHLRRGDYAVPPFNSHYCEVSDASYEKAIEQFHIPKPVNRVFDGWRKFALPPALPVELQWLPDFLLMRDATHLLRANSSFSWWAATLGCGNVYSPVVGDKVGWQDCKFVEGNWPCTAGKFKNQSNLFLKES